MLVWWLVFVCCLCATPQLHQQENIHEYVLFALMAPALTENNHQFWLFHHSGTWRRYICTVFPLSSLTHDSAYVHTWMLYLCYYTQRAEVNAWTGGRRNTDIKRLVKTANKDGPQLSFFFFFLSVGVLSFSFHLPRPGPASHLLPFITSSPARVSHSFFF